MKHILIALAVLACTGAQAQEKSNCGMDKGYVCHSYGKQASCYRTKFAQNYPVCKGPNGYYVCCGKNAAAQQQCDNDEAMAPTTEKRTVVCERNGNMIACYEMEQTRTAYNGPVQID